MTEIFEKWDKGVLIERTEKEDPSPAKISKKWWEFWK